MVGKLTFSVDIGDANAIGIGGGGEDLGASQGISVVRHVIGELSQSVAHSRGCIGSLVRGQPDDCAVGSLSFSNLCRSKMCQC